MQLPFFYIADYHPAQKEIVLDAETSKHIVQVLRMKKGEQVNLTDGKGNLITAEITTAHKKHCRAEVKASEFKPQTERRVSIGISILKNTHRFEWFLEKATEIGVSEIIPLFCERTVRETFRFERMNSILISAMLQSRQYWLPKLHEPVAYKKIVDSSTAQQKLIAHCDDGNKTPLTNNPIALSTIILIGPEGDFTKEETELALKKGFVPVSLGETRLRSETAGVVAAAILCIG